MMAGRAPTSSARAAAVAPHKLLPPLLPLLLLLLLGLASRSCVAGTAAAAGATGGGGGVQELGDAAALRHRVEELHAAGSHVLALFSSPDCTECATFVPQFEDALAEVGEMALDGMVAPTAFVMATGGGKAAYGVESLPGLKWLPAGGQPQEYEGAMDAQDVVAFVRKWAGAPISELDSQERLLRFVNRQRRVAYKDVLVVLASPNGTANELLYDALTTIAALPAWRKAKFAVYSAPEALEELRLAVKALDLAWDAPEGGAAEALVVLRSSLYGVASTPLSALEPAEQTPREYQARLLAFLEESVDLPSAVVSLDTQSFEAALNEAPFALVEFYAPWCGFCQELAPVYEDLAQLARAEMGDRVLIAKVDATAEEDLAERYAIDGFPTLLWFKGEHTFPVTTPERRDAWALLAWVRRRTAPVFQTQIRPATVPAVEAFARGALQGEPRAVLFLGRDRLRPSPGAAEAAYGVDMAFALATDLSPGVWEAYVGEDTEEAFVVFHQDGATLVSPSTTEFWDQPEELRRDLRVGALPLLPLYRDEILDDLITAGFDTVVFLVAPPEDEALATFREFARELREVDGKVAFVHLNVMDPMMDYALEFFLVGQPPGAPGRYVRLVHLIDGDVAEHVFNMVGESGEDNLEPADVTVERLVDFVDGVQAGQIDPMPGSEPMPDVYGPGEYEAAYGYGEEEGEMHDEL